MANDVLNIKRVTLEKIGNAIKIYHAKHSHTITGKIPVREFAKVLRDGKVETTAPVATEDEYIIQLKTLTDVADEIRAIGNTTDEIDVKDFEKTIVELVKKLGQPEIKIKSVEYEGLDDKPTQNTLGKPDITIVTITGYVEEDTQPITVLDVPDIDIMPIEILVEEVKPIRQLETPSIDIIPILDVSTEDVVEVVQLALPSIDVIEITFASEEITVQVLATPSIDILDINKIEEEEITQTTLGTPQIDILDVYFGETSEPAVEQLQEPSINIEEVMVTVETTPSYQLGEPKIDIFGFSVEIEPPIIQIKQLDTPSIEIVEIIGIEKMPFDNYGIIDANGKVQDSHTWAGKAHSNIVAIKDLVNGPNGYCVQDFDTTFPEYPKVLFFSAPHLLSFVGSLNVTDIGSKDTLTVEEIKQYANTLFGGAAYVAFNSDYEEEAYKEDFAYIMADADTYDTTVAKGVLKTPTIDIVPVEVGGEEEPLPVITQLNAPNIQLCIDKEDDTTSILGRAILGKAILGYGGI